jgi:sporulation protein YlmC with PRC-barrel domain
MLKPHHILKTSVAALALGGLCATASADEDFFTEDGSLSWNELEGVEIHNWADEELGEVTDIAINPNEATIAFVAVASEHSDDMHYVPPQAILAAPSEPEAEEGTLRLDISLENWKDAPTLTEAAMAEALTYDFKIEPMYAYYNEVTPEEGEQLTFTYTAVAVKPAEGEETAEDVEPVLIAMSQIDDAEVMETDGQVFGEVADVYLNFKMAEVANLRIDSEALVEDAGENLYDLRNFHVVFNPEGDHRLEKRQTSASLD